MPRWSTATTKSLVCKLFLFLTFCDLDGLILDLLNNLHLEDYNFISMLIAFAQSFVSQIQLVQLLVHFVSLLNYPVHTVSSLHCLSTLSVCSTICLNCQFSQLVVHIVSSLRCLSIPLVCSTLYSNCHFAPLLFKLSICSPICSNCQFAKLFAKLSVCLSVCTHCQFAKLFVHTVNFAQLFVHTVSLLNYLSTPSVCSMLYSNCQFA